MISHTDISDSRYNPPTPAFAKAGAAPGTTGGVELGSRVASKGTRHQGNTSASYTCPSHLHAPAELLHLHAPAICFSGGSRLPFARPQTPQTLPQASKATTLTATCPCHLFSGSSRLPFDRPETLQTLPQASKATTSKRFRRPPRQQLLQLHAPAICFSRSSSLPFASPQNSPNASLQLPCRLPAPALSFYGGSSLPFASPQNSPNASLQLPCRLPAPALSFYGGSSLPFARPQNSPNASLQRPCRLPAPALSFYGGSGAGKRHGSCREAFGEFCGLANGRLEPP